MEHAPIAEWLPERYRNVLDRIADLEAAGRHLDADRIRRAAIRAYSKRWNERTASRLDDLAAQAQHLVAGPLSTRRSRAVFFGATPRSAERHESASAGLAPERPTA